MSSHGTAVRFFMVNTMPMLLSMLDDHPLGWVSNKYQILIQEPERSR